MAPVPLRAPLSSMGSHASTRRRDRAQHPVVDAAVDEGSLCGTDTDDGGRHSAQGDGGGDDVALTVQVIRAPAPTTAMSISVRGMNRK